MAYNRKTTVKQAVGWRSGDEEEAGRGAAKINLAMSAFLRNFALHFMK
jgi:hypothetical protein